MWQKRTFGHNLMAKLPSLEYEGFFSARKRGLTRELSQSGAQLQKGETKVLNSRVQTAFSAPLPD